MTARKPGFYWVKFAYEVRGRPLCDVIVAEWVNHKYLENGDTHCWWAIPGDDRTASEAEIDVIQGPLEMPV